jgi:hypothetical protein
MNPNFRKTTALAVALAAGVLLGTAAPARADLIIQVAEDAAPLKTVLDIVGKPTSDLAGDKPLATTKHYTINILGGESDQEGGMAELLSSVVKITRTSTPGTHVLHIVVLGTGYTGPVTPPAVLVDSEIGGTDPKTRVGNTLVYHSFIGAVDCGAQTPKISVPGSFDNNTQMLLTKLAKPFSVKETLDVTLTKSGDTINYSSSTILTAPEPAVLVLALSALPVAGWGLWRRRTMS